MALSSWSYIVLSFKLQMGVIMDVLVGSVPWYMERPRLPECNCVVDSITKSPFRVPMKSTLEAESTNARSTSSLQMAQGQGLI